MNNKFLIKTLSYPMIATGIIMILLGARWMIHSEPWMLDEVANVERLGMTFEKLFSEEINNTLPEYLGKNYSEDNLDKIDKKDYDIAWLIKNQFRGFFFSFACW